MLYNLWVSRRLLCMSIFSSSLMIYNVPRYLYWFSSGSTSRLGRDILDKCWEVLSDIPALEKFYSPSLDWSLETCTSLWAPTECTNSYQLVGSLQLWGLATNWDSDRVDWVLTEFYELLKITCSIHLFPICMQSSHVSGASLGHLRHFSVLEFHPSFAHFSLFPVCAIHFLPASSQSWHVTRAFLLHLTGISIQGLWQPKAQVLDNLNLRS